MPRKNTIVDIKDVRKTILYEVRVCCPYCKSTTSCEEEYDYPTEEVCYNCGKVFGIKYSKPSKDNVKIKSK